jgi:hypothetical protein
MRKQAHALLAAMLTAALTVTGTGAASPLAFAEGADQASPASAASTAGAAGSGSSASSAAANGATAGSSSGTASDGASSATGTKGAQPAGGSSSTSDTKKGTSSTSGSSSSTKTPGKSTGGKAQKPNPHKQTAAEKKRAAEKAALKKQAKLIDSAKTVTYGSRTVAVKWPGSVSLAVKKASFASPVRAAKSGSGVKQRFYLTRVSKHSKYMIVRSVATGQALQAKGSGVVQATTSKKSNQQWRLRYVKAQKRYVLQNRKTGTYLTLAKNASGQAFTLTKANQKGGKYFSLAKRKAPKMLDKRLLQAQLNRATGAKKLTMFNANYQLSKAQRKKLNKAFSSVKRHADGRLGFVIMDMQTGEGIAYDSNRIFDAASTVKAAYLAGINRYYPKKAKHYRSTMYRVIKWSDNNAYLSLRRAFGSGPMRKQLKAAGVKHVNTTKPWIHYSARDLAKMWTANYAYFISNKPNAKYCRSLYHIPDVSAVRRHFQGKQGRQTWSKSGWISGPMTWNESGVVRTRSGHTYLVSMMSGMNWGVNANWTRMYHLLDAAESVDSCLRY